ncbi:GntR family transcriptional regulator [Pseudarthrobacter sp. GA104]|uniref:GntR family transcriptional regulator n=1 Tax=Pseudarthrobacter sp. GA104 TaxID=2676311 RepID=UPI0012F7DAB7|nr:GntR family transcriptional regulator [Pseudarthrobacter sp. GA104]MUU69703.1 FCD domain-containing protein [Pseudarthrobacter sp. GA104]
MEDETIKTKSAQITQQLRDLISTGELPRGSSLRQDKLAELFNTSITPVREALRSLQAEGLIVGEPHRGVRVASVDLEHLKSTYVMRRLVEGYAIQRSTHRLTILDLQKATDLNRQMEAAYAAGNSLDVGTINRDFHFLFIERCGLAGVTHEAENLWYSYPWDILRVVSTRVPHSVGEHDAIINAARSGDPEEVGRAVGTHLSNSYRTLVKHLTGDDVIDPFDLNAV